MSDNTMEMSLADLPSVFSSEHSGKQSTEGLLNHAEIKNALSEIKKSLKKSGSSGDQQNESSTFKVDTISIDSNMYKKETIDPNFISESNEMAQAFQRVKVSKSVFDYF